MVIKMAARLVKGKARIIDEVQNSSLEYVKFMVVCEKCGRDCSGIKTLHRGQGGVCGGYCSHCDEFSTEVDFVWE